VSEGVCGVPRSCGSPGRMYGVLAVAAGAGDGACRRPAQQKAGSLPREEQANRAGRGRRTLEMIVCLLDGASYEIRHLLPDRGGVDINAAEVLHSAL
jgi:hypothetical protein